MSEAKALNDELDPLPTDPRSAIDVIMRYVKGEDIGVPHLLHAGWVLVGFALSKFDVHAPLAFGAANVEGQTAKQAGESLVAECNARAGIADLDWGTILTLALQFLQLVLAKK